VATIGDDFDVAAAKVPVGAIIDGYEVLEQVGRGGMGVVLRARQPATGQIVAVKMIRENAFGDFESRDRFLQEIETLGRVQPATHVVPIYHVGKHESAAYYVMPYFAAGSLTRHMARFKADRRLAVTLVRQIASALHQLHGHRIIHRDVKPSNILLDEQDSPYLSDFGLAKLLDADESLTRTSQRLGTPTYMAPEQTGLVKEPIAPQVDIWALGVLLYELVVGTRPFAVPRGDDTSGLFWKIVHETPSRPRAVKPDIDRGLDAIIWKCLEKNPSDRFASAAELADELDRWLAGQQVELARWRPLHALGQAIRRRPFASAAIAAVCFALLTAAAIWTWRDPERVLGRMQDRLRAGQAVSLLEKDMPVWSDMLHGPGAIFKPGKDGACTLTCSDRAVVALARDIPVDDYKLRGKIRHESSAMDGRVGVFVGHHGKPMPFGRYELYYQVWFNDIFDAKARPVAKGKPLRNRIQFCPVLYADIAGESEGHYEFGHSWGQPFDASPFAGGQWRTVEINVRAANLELKFESGPHYTVDLAKEMKLLRRDIDDWTTKLKPAQFGVLSACEARFAPGGAIGVFVEGGSAAFSDFVLEPLAEER
jgi:serine/threonine-protein kinase